jgi:DNA-binding beta-propeller fold protein YncE
MLKIRSTLFAFLWIINSLAFSSPQILAVVEENSDRLSFYNTETGTRQGSLKLGFLPHEIAVTKDGKTAYVSNFGIRDYDSGSGVPGVSISVIDLPEQVEKYRLYTHDALENKSYQDIDSAPHGIKLRPPFEKQLYVNVEKGSKVLVYDVDTRQIIKRIAVSPNTHNLFFSKDGKTLWLMAGKDGVIRIDPDSGEITGSLTLPSAVRGLKYTPDNRALMVSAVNQLVLIDPDTLVIQKQYNNLNLGPVLYSDMTPDQKYILAPAPFDHQIAIIEVATGQVIKRLVTGLNPMNILVSPDGQYAYVSNATDKHLSKIDMKTLEMTEIATHDGPNGLAFIPEWHKTQHQKLRLGVVLPLSGKDSAKGRDMLRGYEYWKSHVINGGGLLIGNQVYDADIVYLDSESNNDKIKPLTEQLLSQNQVQVLLSTLGQEAYEQERQVAESHHTLLTPALSGNDAWNPNDIAQGYDYFVTTKQYDKSYIAQYNFKPSAWSAMATAAGLKLQKAVIQLNSLDYQQLMTLLNETDFQLFYA